MPRPPSINRIYRTSKPHRSDSAASSTNSATQIPNTKASETSFPTARIAVRDLVVKWLRFADASRELGAPVAELVAGVRRTDFSISFGFTYSGIGADQYRPPCAQALLVH